MVVEITSGTRWKPRVNPWLIAVTVALAAFMEVLDTSIANVATNCDAPRYRGAHRWTQLHFARH
jgi:hypothetical protein